MQKDSFYTPTGLVITDRIPDANDSHLGPPILPHPAASVKDSFILFYLSIVLATHANKRIIQHMEGITLLNFGE